MKNIKNYVQFLNENYYDDINGYISTSDNTSGFKDGDKVKNNAEQEGIVYDVLVSPDKKNYVVVVKYEKNGMKSIGKYGSELDKFNDIKEIQKIS